MATIRREIPLAAAPSAVWAALRDIGAVPRRLAGGFVRETRMEGDVRVVSFADGLVVRELIVAVDEVERRVAYAVVDGLPEGAHHHASMQVVEDGGRGCRLVWLTDVYPHELAGRL
ncbi:MAG TPA: SRPBCC family protein, partial [Anaeromyxobacteraceae bacterium]|nr:SRPBCC family protein [Anaeromyxobacteraceae bacterium]